MRNCLDCQKYIRKTKRWRLTAELNRLEKCLNFPRHGLQPCLDGDQHNTAKWYKDEMEYEQFADWWTGNSTYLPEDDDIWWITLR